MKIRSPFFFFLFGLVACNTPVSSPGKTDSTIPATAKASQPDTLYATVSGDFDGDGKKEKGEEFVTQKGSHSPVIDGGKPATFAVRFPGTSLPELAVPCCDARIIDQGDLDQDGADELSAFMNEGNGCTYSLYCYTLKHGRWQEIIDPFLVTTFCDAYSDSLVRSRIIRSGDAIFHFVNDMTDPEMKLLRVKDTVLPAARRDN